jgi:inorganic pyrophosphatase/exopolyphosphatase
VFKARIDGDLAYLGPLLSRKKQIVPAIEKSVK